MGLLVAPTAARAIALAYDRAFLAEACGFLAGPLVLKWLTVTDVILARGAASDRDSFGIADYEVCRANAWAADRGLSVLALFHSHPSGDRRLSETDLAALRYSTWPWVIVTLSPIGRRIYLEGYAAGNGQRFSLRVAHSLPGLLVPQWQQRRFSSL
jgi:proteasome lid subunit RPN8/RPN11